MQKHGAGPSAPFQSAPTIPKDKRPGTLKPIRVGAYDFIYAVVVLVEPPTIGEDVTPDVSLSLATVQTPMLE